MHRLSLAVMGLNTVMNFVDESDFQKKREKEILTEDSKRVLPEKHTLVSVYNRKQSWRYQNFPANAYNCPSLSLIFSWHIYRNIDMHIFLPVLQIFLMVPTRITY